MGKSSSGELGSLAGQGALDTILVHDYCYGHGLNMNTKLFGQPARPVSLL